MSYSGQDDLHQHLATILQAKYPSFIYVHDQSDTDLGLSTLKTVLSTLERERMAKSTKFAYAFANCVACFTQRLLFDTVLNALLHFCPVSESRGRGDFLASQRNDSFDDFLHNIRLLFPESGGNCPSILGASKESFKIILAFERVEKLKDTLPRLIHPLSRLQELTRLNISIVFLSAVAWEAVTLIPGTFTDPYIIHVDGLDRQDRICDAFPKDISAEALSMYNPSLEPLFRHFVEAVYNVCSPFTTDPTELAYIVCARWPGYVAPILEDWQEQEDGPYLAPSEEARMRLMRLFNPSLMNAVESLYPRTMERMEWSSANSFPDGFRLSESLSAQLPSSTIPSFEASDAAPKLSVLSMFIVLAAFLASYNPAKTDYRMFGRGVDEKSRRRRKGGGARKTRPGTVAKLPQRLLGPLAFSYDRLIAILGSLLREYDATHADQADDDFLELKSEVDVYRVQTSASIRELISLHFLHRSAAHEKLDSLSFRCGIGYEQALLLARKLGIPLNDLMWEPN